MSALRSTLEGWGYLECPTPVIVPQPGVESTLVAVPAGRDNPPGWLRTSPELALKRVVAHGLCRVYEIAPCFREEERGPWHRREFLLLEWYRVGASLPDLMDEVEALVASVARALDVDPPGPWARRKVHEVFQAYAGVDPWTATPRALSPQDPDDPEGGFFRRWVSDVEPRLTEPTFVSDWPVEQAAAARTLQRSDRRVAARFEAYLGGVELANAFLELTDAPTQRARLRATAAAQARDGLPVWPTDEAFLDALPSLPPTAGIALGVDRLIAVLLGWNDIGRGRADHPTWPAKRSAVSAP